MAPVDDENFASLLAWDDSLNPLRVDIVGDFVGKGLLGIHGEPLVAHCVAQAKVDYAEGFQLLHAVHTVETFLSRLKDRGCNFHLLWFDSQEALSVPYEVPEKYRHKYLLTRQVLIEHFRSFDTNGEPASDRPSDNSASAAPMSFVFPSISSNKFGAYIEEHYLHFILYSRGGPIHNKRTMEHLATMLLFAQRRYSLGFIDDIEFRSSKAYARIITPSSSLPSVEILESTPCDPGLELAQLSEQLLAQDLESGKPGRRMDLRDETALVACASVFAESPSAVTEKHVAAFLVHLALLEHGEIEQRSCEDVTWVVGNDDNRFLEDFSKAATSMIRQVTNGNRAAHVDWRLCDLIDGRLFLHVLHRLDSVNLIVDITHYIHAIKTLTGVDIRRYLPQTQCGNSPADIFESNSRQQIANLQQPQPNASVLPFSHPVLDPYLEEVKLETNDNWNDHAADSKVFQELTHWNNARQAVDSKQRTLRKKADVRALKRNQRFMADTVAYSASLTNASGKNINPERIVAQNVTDKKPQLWREQLPRQQASKAAKKGTKKGRKDALEVAKDVQETKRESRLKAIITFVSSQCKDFDRESSLVKRYFKAHKYFSSLSQSDLEAVGAEVSTYLCDTLTRMMGKPPLGDAALSILAMLRGQALETQSLPLTTDTAEQLRHLNIALDIAISTTHSRTLTERPLPFLTNLSKTSKHIKFPTDATEFQLEHCGPYLERTFDSAPDPRVPFHPDAWQRKVLDVIDQNKSLFVVAPTSAGKTFISFYAMKKILQASNDDALVYVAPTKALVNQIAAEIQARFTKSYHQEGRSVWAIHTRDYRINNPYGCQILVTVPHILQSMMLAPSNAQKPDSWARRVKRIIFDLLKDGYLHGLCAKIDSPGMQKDVLPELLTVLCHLFSRIPCTRYKSKKWLEEVVHRSPSVVLLPRLPQRAETVLRNHNKETLDIFQRYVRTFVDQHLKNTRDDILPFTKRRVGPSQGRHVNLATTGLPIRPTASIRSPFAALSGFTDDFDSIHELCETARAGVFLDESSIPYIPIYPDETGGMPFNAYILDFFKHGDLKALVRDNGIKQGDVWFLLRDFSLVLATITASLGSFLNKNGADFDDTAMIDVQDVGDLMFEEEEEADDEQHVEESGISHATDDQAGSGPKSSRRVAKNKKDVAESWVDEEESDDGSVGSSSQGGIATESSTPTTSWDDDGGAGLVKVHKAFKILQLEFEEKFRKVWA